MQGNSEERFRLLLEQYKQNQLSVEEEEELFAFIRQPEYGSVLEEAVQETLNTSHPEGISMSVQRQETMLAHILRPKVRSMYRWWAAAAAVVLLAVAGAYMWRNTSKPIVTASYDIAPGSNKAMLTLGNGSIIPLDSTGNRAISKGVYQQGARLKYDASETLTYNTLTTPRGGQFQLELPDGTKVWLNAASSIKYTTAFHHERRVAIKGEVYFEVAKNAALPFHVDIDVNTSVEVLGTSFNINAYADEPAVRTTLLEGAVRVNNIVLKPGQQASGNNVTIADIDKVMAWKNGVFNFEDTNLKDAMHQLSRWYDIEVIYESGIPDIQFSGEISRDLPLNSVLKILERARVHLRQDGRKVIISQ